MDTPINIEALSPEQKLELIAELWDSLTRDSESTGAPDWHRKELDRRLERISVQPSEGLSFDEVVRRARKSLRRDQ